MLPQVYSGARATISINKDMVAAAFVADYSIETRATEVETIDMVFPAELAPERVRISMNLKVYRTPYNDPVRDNIAPGLNEIGQKSQYGFAESPYISIEIKDDLDQTILYLPRCWVVRRTGSASAGDFLTETWSIIAMDYVGPSGASHHWKAF